MIFIVKLPSFFQGRKQTYRCKNKDFCGILIASQEDNILQFNQHINSDKTPKINFADLESFINKIDECAKKLQQKQVNIILGDIQCQLYGFLKI